jgi:hypothetical protein
MNPSGRLSNLVTTSNRSTGQSLVMLSRFQNVNETGTLSFPIWPQDATRVSLYGNTEIYDGLANVFPAFKLTGLNPRLRYNFTFYASRMGANDNRETGYTVRGANSGFAALNPANNITNRAAVTGIQPDRNGEISVHLGPTPNNNNTNHFTYLGVMKVSVTPVLLAPVLSNNFAVVQWEGEGQVESSSTPNGPWSRILPTPSSPFLQPVIPGQNRFFRIIASP